MQPPCTPVQLPCNSRALPCSIVATILGPCFCKKTVFLRCLTILIVLCDFWVLSYFLQRFHVFVDICVFSCLSFFLSDWLNKLWCRQCFCDFGTNLVFSYRKRLTWRGNAFLRTENSRATPVQPPCTPVQLRCNSRALPCSIVATILGIRQAWVAIVTSTRIHSVYSNCASDVAVVHPSRLDLRAGWTLESLAYVFDS